MEKQQVFNDIYRILKSRGRVAISDVIIRQNMTLPTHLKTNKALSCWVAGAPEKSNLKEHLLKSGFINISIDEKEESKDVIKQWMEGSNAEDYIISANIVAYKP